MNNRSKYDRRKGTEGKPSTKSERKSWKPKNRHEELGANLDDMYDKWLEKEQQRNRRQHP